MAQIGLKNFHYAICTNDNDSVTSYGIPKKVVGINSIDINPTVQRSTMYGDDVPLATTSNVSEITVRIAAGVLTIEDEASLLGHTITDGVMVYKSDDKAPYVAIMYESDTHDGKVRFDKYYKGKFSETQKTINTRGESVEYQLPEIEGSFVARESDRKLMIAAVSDSATLGTEWYASV